MNKTPLIKDISSFGNLYTIFNINKEWYPYLVNRKRKPVKRLMSMKKEFGFIVNGQYVFLGFVIRPDSAVHYYHKQSIPNLKDFKFWNGHNLSANPRWFDYVVSFEKEIFSKQFHEKIDVIINGEENG